MGLRQQNSNALQRKVSDLEARYSTLEDEYRNAVAVNEGNRRKLTQLESQRAELAQQVEDLKVAVQERDELKAQLAQRTNERDAAHASLSQFSKELQTLVNRVETAASVNYGETVGGVPVSRHEN